MAISRIAAQTVTQLIAITRRKLGDPDTNSGGSIPDDLRRWSDAAIQATLNEVLTEMGTDLAILHEGDALLFSDFTYVEESDRSGMRLPAAVAADGILYVEDITSSSYPIRFPYVSPLEISDYVDLTDSSGSGQGTYRVYTLIADATATASPPFRILVRPSPSSRSLRVWYVAPPLIAGVVGDASPLSSRWTEHIAVSAAVKLTSIDEELPAALAAVHINLQKQFKEFCARQKGPERIRLARWRSC